MVAPTETPSAGRIILLNGASCSGKTTLARALQEVLEEPYMHLGADQVLGMLPHGRNWREPGNQRAVYKAMSGMHRCAATLAAAGNHVILDTILLNDESLIECVVVLAHFRVTFVGVLCDPDELDRREQQRTHAQPGTARAQAGRIHRHRLYDLEVDTSKESAQTLAKIIDQFQQRHAWPQAFSRLRRERVKLSLD